MNARARAAQEWPRWGDGFWGVPFIWTKLHNFGANDGLKGNLTRAAMLPFRAQRDDVDGRHHIVGSGFTPEGIDQNPAYCARHVRCPQPLVPVRDVG